VVSGLAALKALSFSGSGLPVAGSAVRAIMNGANCSGLLTKNTGAETLEICQTSPPGRLNCSASPRTDRLLSLALALPPPSEKRAMTGILSPRKAEALDSERPPSSPVK
jgi:hypothetical protein